MPNRIIKESICENDQIDQLSLFEETCFYRLIVNVDDYGRCDARPSFLRSRLFPLREIPPQQIEAALNRLQDVGLIGRYQVDGRSYLFLPGWFRNQCLRRKRIKYPPPPGWQEDAPPAPDRNAPDFPERPASDDDPATPDCLPEDVSSPIVRNPETAETHSADLRLPSDGSLPQSADRLPPVFPIGRHNPIQSESQSQSQSQSQSENESETQQESLKKENDDIYNDSWKFSPRARSATANILAQRFCRENLPCAQLRDLFVVIEHALALGVDPESITHSARQLSPAEFAATYLSR